jgi:solute carrier family 25 (mitochondrial folate transporter), member 32
LEKSNYEQRGYSEMNSVLIASTEASLFGTIVTQPLWVVKTRMLLNTTSRITEIQNLVFSCRQIQRQNGLKGYSKGLGLSLILSFSGVVQMYTYEGLKKCYTYLNIAESKLLEKNFICGAICKLFVVLLTYPITTVRTRIQQNQFIKN